MSTKALTAGMDAPLRGGMLWITAIVLATANFMAVLDMTIANVSVPNIAGGLGISSSQGTGVITSYAVAEGIIVPLTGWLAGRFGAGRAARGLAPRTLRRGACVRDGDGIVWILLGGVRSRDFARHAGVRPRDA